MAELKIPTWDDYLAYDGAHCSYKWKQLNDNWRCPGCNRTKFELLRWNKERNNWLAILHEHHDHFDDHSLDARFQPIIICDHCNSVDAQVKIRFKGSMFHDFSFSPYEIRHIITARPHRGI